MLGTIAMAMTHIRIAASAAELVFVVLLAIVPIATVAAAWTQPHRADPVVHVAIVQIAVATRRIGLHAEHAAKAVVARENVHAMAVRGHRAEAIVGHSQAIAFAWRHLDVVLLAAEFGVRPEGDSGTCSDGSDQRYDKKRCQN